MTGRGFRTAIAFALLVSPAGAAVKPVGPENKAELPRTFRMTGCSTAKPRQMIRLRLSKVDKDGRLVEVGIVLIPKDC